MIKERVAAAAAAGSNAAQLAWAKMGRTHQMHDGSSGGIRRTIGCSKQIRMVVDGLISAAVVLLAAARGGCDW